MFPFDQNNQPMYQQYAQAYNSGNYSGIDPNQAAMHVQQFAQNAPPQMQQQVYQQHFEQMPYEQRQQFVQQMPPQYQQGMDPNNPQGMAQGFTQMGQQHPNMLQQALGGLGGNLGGALTGGIAAGLAGAVANHLIGDISGGRL